MDFVDDLWSFAPTGTLYAKLMQEKYMLLINIGLSMILMIGYFVCIGTPVIPEIIGICFRDAWASHSVYLGLVLLIDALFRVSKTNTETIVGLYYLPNAIFGVIGETVLFAAKVVLTIPALVLATLSCCCCGCSSGLLLGAIGYKLWKKIPTEECEDPNIASPHMKNQAASSAKFPTWMNQEFISGMWQLYQGTAVQYDPARRPPTTVVIVEEHDEGEAAAAKLAVPPGENVKALQLLS